MVSRLVSLIPNIILVFPIPNITLVSLIPSLQAWCSYTKHGLGVSDTKRGLGVSDTKMMEWSAGVVICNTTQALLCLLCPSYQTREVGNCGEEVDSLVVKLNQNNEHLADVCFSILIPHHHEDDANTVLRWRIGVFQLVWWRIVALVPPTVAGHGVVDPAGQILDECLDPNFWFLE